jgi:hypothetical protein
LKLKPKKYYEGILYLGILQTKNNKQTIFKREYNIKKIELFWYSIFDVQYCIRREITELTYVQWNMPILNPE